MKTTQDWPVNEWNYLSPLSDFPADEPHEVASFDGSSPTSAIFDEPAARPKIAPHREEATAG